jgi:hypothetical protein
MKNFAVAVFASEHVLDGYVPRLGEDVEGILWLQGRVIGPCIVRDTATREKRDNQSLLC